MKNPFRYFNSAPEVIRLTVMLYIRYPLSLRQGEDILFERGQRSGNLSSTWSFTNVLADVRFELSADFVPCLTSAQHRGDEGRHGERLEQRANEM